MTLRAIKSVIREVIYPGAEQDMQQFNFLGHNSIMIGPCTQRNNVS
jgi:hypothetical protein